MVSQFISYDWVICILFSGGGGLWHLDLWTIEEEIAAIEDKRIEVFGFFTQLEHLWMLWLHGTNLITAASIERLKAKEGIKIRNKRRDVLLHQTADDLFVLVDRPLFLC